MAQATRFWWRLSDRHTLERATARTWRSGAVWTAAPPTPTKSQLPPAQFGGLSPASAAYPGSASATDNPRRLLAAVTGVVIVMLTGIVLLGATPRGRTLAPGVTTAFDKLQLSAGFELRQITVEGHRSTGVGVILDAAGLAVRTASLTYDAEAARTRILDLPWIDTARLAVTLPDMLEISVTERAPFAIWEGPDGQSKLIDASGRVLGPIGLGLEVMLPVVAGAGAPPIAARLLTLVARHPTVAYRMQKAERVSERRWTLHLTGGSVALLPADEVDAAVARLEPILKDPEGQRAGPRVIDLRLENTMIERRRDPRPSPTAQ